MKMDEKKRTKILAAGLVAVIAVYSLRSTLDGFLMKPIRDLQRNLNMANAENESLKLQEIKFKVARKKLDDWKYISLPQNQDDAQRLYREWLHELTRQCGFSGPGFEVTPGARSQQKEFGTVGVEVKKAETDLQGLTRFLFLFDQADMLHRISAMKIDSPGAQGNPRLLVSFTAEGMSVIGGDDKTELQPRTTITSGISESAAEISVVPNESIIIEDPFRPFLVRVERELLRVEAVDGSAWKVQRGFSGTKAAAHPEKSTVELLPVAWDRQEKTLEQYADFVKGSVFVIPSPPKTWNPRLAGVSDKTIKPGEEVKFTVRAESFNPEFGEPQFSLAEPVEGMSINSATGEFAWKPAETMGAGEYATTVMLTQSGNPELKLNSKVKFTIRSDNQPPVLTLAESAIVVIGREFAETATATDDGPTASLKYSLGAGAPEGLSIDAVTGQLKWTPSRTFTPGKYDVEVKVTDSGEEPKSASRRIALDVQDDNAALTLLSAALSKDGVWYAWFRNKGTGKTEQLKVSEKLKVSEINVEIVVVTHRFVTLRDQDGVWKLQLGQTLRERKLIEPAAKVEQAAPAAEPVEPATTAEEAPQADPSQELTQKAGQPEGEQSQSSSVGESGDREASAIPEVDDKIDPVE
ncbi:MAG: putative Ig domain-containing protein [Planctomycetales bacterium]|nr:putative Ig domain-containing protein [Planctomycetales bacterium]